MSRRTILVESDAAGLRAALMIDRRLEAIEIDSAASPTPVGAVMAAKVCRTVSGIGTIVQTGDGAEWLLARGRSGAVPGDGTVLTIQTRQAPRGDKLGTAAQSVSLAGRALIHLPFETGISVSRRAALTTAAHEAVEQVLADHPGGWIIRRTAAEASVADIAAEAAALAAIGREGEVRAPDAFRRLVTDYGLPEPDSITVAGRVAEGVVKRWCEAFALRLLSRVAVGEAGLFDAHDLDRAIEALVQPCVLLPRSGSLIIEPTAALVAIDVNAGAGSNALAANLAATSEIARHLRLRHLGGIIVIDFISMSRPADRARVTASLAAALADDPAQTHILPMSALGLVEMTRERRGPGLPA